MYMYMPRAEFLSQGLHIHIIYIYNYLTVMEFGPREP